mgnify:FL=1
MEPLGYLHNKMDVKVLVLFILSRIDSPLRLEDLYEVAYQDDSLNYFTLVESIGELQSSGHITTDADGRYYITDKGRTQGSYVEDSLAVPVVQKVSTAIADKINQLHRESMLTADTRQDENGRWSASVHYRDGDMPMMSLSLMAPNEEVGKAMAENMKRSIAQLYKTAMDCATGPARKKKEPAE